VPFVPAWSSATHAGTCVNQLATVEPVWPVGATKKYHHRQWKQTRLPLLHALFLAVSVYQVWFETKNPDCASRWKNATMQP